MMATFPPSVPAIFARAFPSQKMSSTQVGLRFAEFGIYHQFKILSINLIKAKLKHINNHLSIIIHGDFSSHT